MSNPIVEIVKVNYRSFFREPGIVFWAIIFPMVIAFVLGFAFSEKGEIRKTVYITDQGIADTLAGKTLQVPGLETPVFITFKKASEENTIKAVKRGETTLYLKTEQGRMQYFYDPRNPDAMNTHLLLDKLFSREPANAAELKAINTSGNRYIDFLIPGLLAMGIMNSCMWGIGYNLIEYRMKKLLRRMIATPMKKSHFLIAGFIFRTGICLLEAVTLIVFAIIFFGIEVQGSWLAFTLLFLSGILCFSGIAIIAASRAQSTQVGNGVMNAVILPMTILSGIFFSYHNFPDWAQVVIKYLPLTMLADNIRAVFIEGAGLEVALFPVCFLSAVGIICYAIGLKIFKWY